MLSLVEVGLSNAACAVVLALFVVVVGLVCRRPAVMHVLWLLVLVKLLTPPLVRIPLYRPVPASSPGTQAEPAPDLEWIDWQEDWDALEKEARPFGEEEPPAAVVSPEDRAAPPTPASPAPEGVVHSPESAPAAAPAWRSWLAGVWLLGSLGWFVLASRRAWQFSRVLRLGRAADADFTQRVEHLAQQLGVRHGPHIWLVPGRLTPMIWGVRTPWLLVPEHLESQVGRAGMDALVMHELAHVKRRDQWVRVLEFVVLGLYWWNPLVWFARRELREVEEQCCDAWVVRALPGSGRTYATAIVDALDFVAQASWCPPPLASGLGHVADLKRRLKMILRGTTPHGLGHLASVALLLVALVVLPLVPGSGHSQAVKEPTAAGVVQFLSLKETKVDNKDLAKLEEALKAKLAEVEALRKKMEEVKKAVTVEKAKGPTIRIEISGVTGKADDLKDLVKKLEEVIPGKDKRVVIIQGGPADVFRWVPRANLALRMAGTPPVVKPFPGVPGVPAVPAVPTPNKRIDDLEKKVDAILKELDGLRKDLKTPRPGGPGRSRLFFRGGTSEEVEKVERVEKIEN